MCQSSARMLGQYGTCYEYDIPFAKRYSVDKEIVPLTYYKIEVSETKMALSLRRWMTNSHPCS